jgi:hypothetical protein
VNLSVEHRLAFDYDSYISESFLELRVQPKSVAHQWSTGAAPPNKGIYRGNASETLHADVRTALNPKPRIPGGHRGHRHPRLQGDPPRRADYDAALLVEQAAQQQQ